MTKSYYKKLHTEIARKLNEHKGMFSFAVVADSHLDNSVPDTCDNIRAVSDITPFECVVHLGDLMCGGFPRKAFNALLAQEIDLFRSILPNGHFYAARGNHEGFKDRINGGSDIRLDTDWYEATQYLETLPNVSRKSEMPYYYVDYPESKVRLIALNSFFYREVDGAKVRGGVNGYDDAQLEWFRNDALCAPSGWTVVAFAHDAPMKNFDENYATDNPIYNGNAMLDAIKNAKEKNGINFAAWLVGHYHGDMAFCADGINIVLVASETAYVPTLWDMPDGGHYPQRELGTTTEDLWDAVCIDTAQRKLHFFRFGAGCDREFSY